jgi:hypothetical protein
MINVVTPVLIGLVSTLVTLVLTPRLQHYFWGYQRMSELRLNTYIEVNNLAAEFLNKYIDDPGFRPTDKFFRALTVATANVKTMFSQDAFACFKEFEAMVGPELGPTGEGSIDRFVKARDAALKALYSEAVVAKLFNQGAKSGNDT